MTALVRYCPSSVVGFLCGLTSITLRVQNLMSRLAAPTSLSRSVWQSCSLCWDTWLVLMLGTGGAHRILPKRKCVRVLWVTPPAQGDGAHLPDKRLCDSFWMRPCPPMGCFGSVPWFCCPLWGVRKGCTGSTHHSSISAQQ